MVDFRSRLLAFRGAGGELLPQESRISVYNHPKSGFVQSKEQQSFEKSLKVKQLLQDFTHSPM